MSETKKYYALISIEIIADSPKTAKIIADATARQLDLKYDNKAFVHEIGHYDSFTEQIDLTNKK